MTQPSNKCYKRVYVGDLAGSTITVNGTPIVNNINGDTVVGIDKIGAEDTDAFGNRFFHIDRYEKKTVDNQDTVQGLYIGRDHITKEHCDPCTNAGGTPIADPNTTFCTVFNQVILPGSTSILKNDIDTHWVRRDVDCLPTTPRQLDSNNILVPKANTPEFYIERNVDNELFVNDCKPRNPFTILVPVDAGNLAFTYMNGDFILTIEGDTVTSATNTTILVPEEGNV